MSTSPWHFSKICFLFHCEACECVRLCARRLLTLFANFRWLLYESSRSCTLSRDSEFACVPFMKYCCDSMSTQSIALNKCLMLKAFIREKTFYLFSFHYLSADTFSWFLVVSQKHSAREWESIKKCSQSRKCLSFKSYSNVTAFTSRAYIHATQR
jgi:hypothetical protein